MKVDIDPVLPPPELVIAGHGRIASVICRNDRLFRADLVARIRREIAAGTYDTEEKFEAALDRMLDRLAQD